MNLPNEFIKRTRALFGEARFERFMSAMAEESPVSVRLNTQKIASFFVGSDSPSIQAQPSSLKKVPWCRDAYYIHSRPMFTFDPLFHAGCYYVQEASSMFLDRILEQYVKEPITMLDMCAAPGGKSTIALSALPEGSTLVSNEPISKRASVLKENISKWLTCKGKEDHGTAVVTSNYPTDFERLGDVFDIILCDVPCSGEGMFRKDANAVKEWSVANVEASASLQRKIVASAWKCLKPGGLMIYSTCTYNVLENEENIAWIAKTYDTEVLPVDIDCNWGVTGSLLEGFDEPIYRFIPGFTDGEGLFMCVMCKGPCQREKSQTCLNSSDCNHNSTEGQGGRGHKQQKHFFPMKLHVLPLALTDYTQHYTVDLCYDDAVAYLRRESLVLASDTPRGIVVVTYKGVPLGIMKNIGVRANNLYPKEWRIMTTHIPDGPVDVLSDLMNIGWHQS